MSRPILLTVALALTCSPVLQGQEPAGQTSPAPEASADVESGATDDHLTDLIDGDLTALVERFDQDVGKARLVVILSPTCGACVAGARVVHDQLTSGLAGQDGIRVYVVWTIALPGDDRSAALRAGASLVDPRVHQYWDPMGALGHAYGTYLPLPDYGVFAWDVYLLYHRFARWGDEVPPFMAWWHKFADDERTLDGPDLCSEVATLMGKEGICHGPE